MRPLDSPLSLRIGPLKIGQALRRYRIEPLEYGVSQPNCIIKIGPVSGAGVGMGLLGGNNGVVLLCCQG